MELLGQELAEPGVLSELQLELELAKPELLRKALREAPLLRAALKK